MSGSTASSEARIVLATRNPGKLREFRKLLSESPGMEGFDLETAVVDAATAGCPDIPETGVTFTENALLKAREVSRWTGLPAVADDSGLAVDVLGGAPGIFSARWAGAKASDEANLQLLLQQLADIDAQHRGADFVCVAALVTPEGAEVTAEGRLRGMLLKEPRGEEGFGYDPILQPDGESRSVAELSMAEKNEISHRGLAFAELSGGIVKVMLNDDAKRSGRTPEGHGDGDHEGSGVGEPGVDPAETSVEAAGEYEGGALFPHSKNFDPDSANLQPEDEDSADS